MALIVCNECGKRISDRASACPECGCPIAQDGVSAMLQRKECGVLSKEKIIEYLYYALNLERAACTYQKAMDSISRKYPTQIEHQSFSVPKEKKADYRSIWSYSILVFIIALFVCCHFLGDSAWDALLILLIVPLFWASADQFLAIGVAAGITVVLFVVISIVVAKSIENENSDRMYEYKRKVANEEKRIKNATEGNEKIKTKLKQQQNLLQVEYEKNQELLNKLYSLNIIFPKYRNLAAITTFLEYFESGICDSFIGAYGAYSRYEDDVKIGRIIEQLDVAVNSLNRIAKTQYLLYQSLVESNSIASDIANQAARIAETNERIEENAKLIKYNTERIAYNTSVSEYIVKFGRY